MTWRGDTLQVQWLRQKKRLTIVPWNKTRYLQEGHLFCTENKFDFIGLTWAFTIWDWNKMIWIRYLYFFSDHGCFQTETWKAICKPCIPLWKRRDLECNKSTKIYIPNSRIDETRIVFCERLGSRVSGPGGEGGGGIRVLIRMYRRLHKRTNNVPVMFELF